MPFVSSVTPVVVTVEDLVSMAVRHSLSLFGGASCGSRRKTLFKDAGRLERASGALSALKLQSLPLAARCLHHPLSLKTACLTKF